MKKTIIALAILLFANAGTFAQTKKDSQNKTTPTAVKYTCPMHKDVVSDKPGKCPKCEMTLVKMKPVKKSKTKA